MVTPSHYINERARAILERVDVNARGRAAQSLARELPATDRANSIKTLQRLAETALPAGERRASVLNVFRYLRNDQSPLVRVAAGAALMRIDPISDEVRRHVEALPRDLQRPAWTALDQGCPDEQGRLDAIRSLCAPGTLWQTLPVLRAIEFDSQDEVRELVRGALYPRGSVGW